MFYIDLFLTLLAAYFVKKEYDNGRMIWLALWAMLFGWDLHTLLTHL